MDPEFYRKLKNRPDEIRRAQEAVQAHEAQLATHQVQRRVAEQNLQDQQVREQRRSNILSNADFIWENVPVISAKLEALRAAIGIGPIARWMPEDVDVVRSTFPFKSFRGRTIEQTGTVREYSPGSGPQGMGGMGSPGGWYDKPTYGMFRRELSNNVGIMLDVGEYPTVVIGYYINKWYKMSQSEISGNPYRIFNPFHARVYKNYEHSSTFIPSLQFEYPRVNNDFKNQLESGLTELHDAYVRIKDFEINP